MWLAPQLQGFQFLRPTAGRERKETEAWTCQRWKGGGVAHTWGEGRVKEVNVECKERSRVPHHRSNQLADLCRSLGEQLGGGENSEPKVSCHADVARSIHRPSHAKLDGLVWYNQPLLHGPSERSAVGVLVAVVRVPQISMRIEVHQCERAVDAGQSAQLS